MKISINERPIAIDSSNKVTSLKVDNYGNIYSVSADATVRTEKKQIVKALAKTRF